MSFSGTSSSISQKILSPFSSALNSKTDMQSSKTSLIDTSCMLSRIFLFSSWEKSRMSLTRYSIRLELFLAMLKNFAPLSLSIMSCSSQRLCVIALRGLRNSCAAEAKANVFILLIVFCFSSSSHLDMSLIVVMTRPLAPVLKVYEKTWSFLISQSSSEYSI